MWAFLDVALRRAEDASEHRPADAWAFRRSQLVRPQKWGKGPFSAAIICARGGRPGRVRGWARWDAYRCSDHGCPCGWVYVYEPGEPMGRPWATPLIQITAASEDQTDNVYRQLVPMIELGPLADVIPDTGETRINLPGGGRIDPVTSKARSRLGQPVTFVLQDETGTWTEVERRPALADTQRRGLAGMGGRAIETTNAWDPAENSVAQQTAEAAAKDIYRDHRQAPKTLSYGDRRGTPPDPQARLRRLLVGRRSTGSRPRPSSSSSGTRSRPSGSSATAWSSPAARGSRKASGRPAQRRRRPAGHSCRSSASTARTATTGPRSASRRSTATGSPRRTARTAGRRSGTRPSGAGRSPAIRSTPPWDEICRTLQGQARLLRPAGLAVRDRRLGAALRRRRLRRVGDLPRRADARGAEPLRHRPRHRPHRARRLRDHRTARRERPQARPPRRPLHPRQAQPAPEDRRRDGRRPRARGRADARAAGGGRPPTRPTPTSM
jgi:hypothetical protein